MIPEVGRSLEEGHGNPSSILAWRIPMDRGVWQATVHEVEKSQIQLRDLAQHSTVVHKYMKSEFKKCTMY